MLFDVVEVRHTRSRETDAEASARAAYIPGYRGNRGHQPEVGYLVRSGGPDAFNSIVPMAYGNLALDLILSKTFGHSVVSSGRPLQSPADHHCDRIEKIRKCIEPIRHGATVTHVYKVCD